MAEDPLQFVGV